jgi:NADPH:quinone reductase-like Zn-dependent oxidoreductase
MRAARITELGSPPRVEEIDSPERAAGQALIAPSSVPLNPIDVATAAGRFYGGSPPVPYTPGSEGVGRIVEAESLASGARVYMVGDGLGRKRDGTMAERAVAAEEVLIPLPDEISDELAGTCGTAGIAGWLPVVWRAQTKPVDRVLVLGATGTVGLAAVQAARLVGASRIVAAGRRPEALERALEAGAHAAVVLEGDDVAGALREAAGGEGPTVVVDPLWGPPLVAALEAAAPGARIVQLGQSAGAVAEIPSALVRGKQLEILGYSNLETPREVRRQGYLDLVAHAAAGRVDFPLERYPLDRVAEAWERQAAGPGAKLIVLIR